MSLWIPLYIYIIIALCCGFVFIHGSYICIFVYILLVNILEQKPNWIDQIPQDWCLNPRSVAGYYIILLVASCHTSYSHYIASSISPHHGWFLYPHICWFSPHIFAGSNYSTPPHKDICPICSYTGTNWTPGNRGGHIIELTSWKEFSNVFYLFGGCYMGHPNMFVLNRDPLFTCFLKKWDFQSIYSWVPLLPRTPSHQHWWDPLHLHLCRFLQTRRWAMDRGVGRWGTDGKAEIG